MKKLIATLAVSMLAACGSEPEPEGLGRLVIGTSLTEGAPGGYAHMADGAELTLEPGAQGGFHVYISIRIDEEGMALFEDKPFLSRQARRESTNELVSRSQHRVSMVESPDAAGFFETEKSFPLFLCPTPIDIPVADEMLILKIEAGPDHESPAVLEGEIRFRPRCPEGDQKAFCESICYG